MVQLEQLLRCVRQLSERQRRIQVDFASERGDDLLSVVAVGEDATRGDQAVNRVGDGADEHAKLIATVDVLLLQAQDHGAEILVVGEVVPMLLRAVKVLFVGLLLDGGETELAVFLPLLFNWRLFPTRLANPKRQRKSLTILGNRIHS